MEFVERELRARGVVDLVRDPVPYRRWFTADDPAAGRWTLAIAGASVPVASYWAYSGSTGEQGVTAPLVHYDAKSPPATIEGRLGEILQKGKAAGGIVIFDMGAARARGIYTFPLLKPGELGVPAIYLDRQAGAVARAAAKDGKPATLRLVARHEDATGWFLTGILPGRDHGTPADELVLLLTQENGALGILALVDYFSQVPREQRARSLLIVLDPQHYMPGRHLVDWYQRHPELTARISGVIGVEQLGQREYAERGDAFVQTGRPEVSVIFSPDDPQLIAMARDAIAAAGVPRTELRVPARKGQGRWIGLADVSVERGWPAFALNTEMSAYWSTAPGIESFDAALARKQLDLLRRLTEGLMEAEVKSNVSSR